MFDRLIELIEALEKRVSVIPMLRWAIVTQTSPLRIQYDAEPTPLAGTPDSVAGSLSVGERVLCVQVFRRDIVLARAKGKRTKVLWTGAAYMHASQTAKLLERVSEQDTGILLVWRAFASNAVINRDTVYTFIPKWHVETSEGGGVQSWMGKTMTSAPFAKYVYVSDDRLTGYGDNAAATHNSHVLVAVLGV